MAQMDKMDLQGVILLYVGVMGLRWECLGEIEGLKTCEGNCSILGVVTLCTTFASLPPACHGLIREWGSLREGWQSSPSIFTRS